MALGLLHGSVDAFAVWTEDRLRRAPEQCRLGTAAPLSCFGPLSLPSEPTPRTGSWSVASPRPLDSLDRIWVHSTPARGVRRGTTLLVPPWKIGSPELVSGYTRLLADAGYDVWLVCPPRHLERTPAGARSGEDFVSLDLARLRATFEQFVLEVRLCTALAALQGKVGLVGLSLGGLVGAFAATAPERLEFAALIAPAHLSLVVAETGIGRRYRRLATLAGSAWPEQRALATALAPFDPASRMPTADRLFIAAGLYDRIVPSAGAGALGCAWRTPARLYPRGHISLLFLCRALRKDLASFAGG